MHSLQSRVTVSGSVFETKRREHDITPGKLYFAIVLVVLAQQYQLFTVDSDCC